MSLGLLVGATFGNRTSPIGYSSVDLWSKIKLRAATFSVRPIRCDSRVPIVACNDISSLFRPVRMRFAPTGMFRGSNSIYERPWFVEAAWLLPVLLLLTIPVSVQAQFNYTTTNGTVAITQYTGSGGDVIIPSSILVNGVSLPVISIGDYAFATRSSVTGVLIPNSITSIGDLAFTSCYGLTSITIPNSVTNIGSDAFYYCYYVTNVTIGDSVSRIGDRAFYYCLGLTNITIGNSVTSIGDAAFASCLSLNTITVDVNNSAFCSVDGVLFSKSKAMLIQYPAGKTQIYTIPNSVTSIGNSAFHGCNSLTNISIPSSAMNIGSKAFVYCINLTNITIPNSVINIGDDAFHYCYKLAKVTIASSVTNIGESAFGYCGSLTAITVDTFNNAYSSVAGVLLDKSQTTLIQYPGGKAGNYTIPDNVITIGGYAFCSCTGLTDVTISTNVTSIANHAFELCTSLTRVAIPNSVTNVGSNSFVSCTSLTNIIFPSSVSSIGDYTFRNCTSLASFTVPNSITSVGVGAFYQCSKLASIVIPNSVTSFGNVMLAGCASLTSVALPSGCTNVPFGMFSGCSSLTNITIPESLISIGDDAFYGCTRLVSVTIPATVTNIGNFAFASCSSLRGVYCTGNAPGAPMYTFNGANMVTVFYFPETTGWNSTFAGRPTMLWNPQMHTDDASFGVRTNRFGFNITGTSNLVIVVEVCTNLANPVWLPVQYKILNGGSSYFSDPKWTNNSSRFYRLRSY